MYLMISTYLRPLDEVDTARPDHFAFMDGLEAVRAIRGSGGPQASTPVVALTANAMAHQAAAYLAAGMDGVVAKPVSPTALLAEVVRLAGAPAAARAA